MEKLAETEAYATGIYQDIQVLSEAFSRDPLTGLLGRRGLEDAYERTAAAQRRNHKPGAIMFTDLDNFKDINQELGHSRADKLLRSIGKLLESNVRRTDYVGRAHGDEFILILPETDLDQSEALAEKLRRLVSEKNMFGIAVTMSIGVDLIDPSLDFEDAYHHANGAMFEAKREGKDRVVIARSQR